MLQWQYTDSTIRNVQCYGNCFESGIEGIPGAYYSLISFWKIGKFQSKYDDWALPCRHFSLFAIVQLMTGYRVCAIREVRARFYWRLPVNRSIIIYSILLAIAQLLAFAVVSLFILPNWSIKIIGVRFLIDSMATRLFIARCVRSLSLLNVASLPPMNTAICLEIRHIPIPV